MFILPLLWMVSTSLKPADQTTSLPPQWLPWRYTADVEGERLEVRPIARLVDSGWWALPEGASTPIFLVNEDIVDGSWTMFGHRRVSIELIQKVDSSEEEPWREVALVSDGSRYVVPEASFYRSIYPRWGNYPAAIESMQRFGRYLFNTVLLCVLNVVGTVFSCSLVAYGFSRISWRGRDTLFSVLLATMMIPFPVVMVPLYSLFRSLGWVGTIHPLWVGSLFAGAFNVFLLRQFFKTIPKELSEAARIDGCSEFRIYWSIILPLCCPALIVVGLFTFLGTWNDFLGPLIYLTDEKDFTLALALQSMQAKSGLTDWQYLMAASTLIILPVITLFVAAQRHFIESIALTGSKS